MIIDRDVLKKSLLDMKGGTITIKSYNSGNNKKWTAKPWPDKSNSWYKGVQMLSQKVKEGGESYVDPTNPDNVLSKFDVYNGVTIDTGNLKDRLVLRWLVENENLALSFEEGHARPMVQWYIHDEATSEERTNKLWDARFEAFKAIKDCNFEMAVKIARLMGFNTGGLSFGKVTTLLFQEAQSDPMKILTTLADKLRDYKDIAKRLMEASIVVKKKKGLSEEYLFGQHSLGVSFEGLVAFIQEASDIKNLEKNDLFLQMMGQLK